MSSPFYFYTGEEPIPLLQHELNAQCVPGGEEWEPVSSFQRSQAMGETEKNHDVFCEGSTYVDMAITDSSEGLQ